MTMTARAYAQENRDKAIECEKAAREREDRHAAIYWHGYATAMAAVVADIDSRRITGLY